MEDFNDIFGDNNFAHESSSAKMKDDLISDKVLEVGLDDLGLDEIDFSSNVEAKCDVIPKNSNECDHLKTTSGCEDTNTISWSDIGGNEQNDFLLWLDGNGGNVDEYTSKKEGNEEFTKRLRNEILKENTADVDVIVECCLSIGFIPADLRVAIWIQLLKVQHRDPTISASIKNTNLDLREQEYIRQDLEHMMSRLSSSSDKFGNLNFDENLLFLEQSEKVFTYFCKRHSLQYPKGLCIIFSSLFAMHTQIDPSQAYCVVYGICSGLLKHVMIGISSSYIADARRSLVKMILLYHDPILAIHLDHHFSHWINKPEPNCISSIVNKSKSGVIPDSWLASMFETLSCEQETLWVVWDRIILSLNPVYNVFLTIAMVLHVKEDILRFTGEDLINWMRENVPNILKDRDIIVRIASVADQLVQASPLSIHHQLHEVGFQEIIPYHVDDSIVLNNGTDQKNTEDSLYSPAFFSVSVSAAEVVPSIIRGRRKSVDDKIRYFVVDCRYDDEVKYGKLPTAYHLDPRTLLLPETINNLMITLNPLKGSVHICIIGQGYSREQSKQNSDMLNLIAMDRARINDTVLFLTKQGYPFVSVIQGGYFAIHDFLLRSTLFDLSDLADHSPHTCKTCLDATSTSVQYDMWNSGSFQLNQLDSRGHHSYKSLTEAIRGGKNWLQRKREDPVISETIREGKKWLRRKREEADSRFSEMSISDKIPFRNQNRLGDEFAPPSVPDFSINAEDSCKDELKSENLLDSGTKISSKFRNRISSLRKEVSLTKVTESIVSLKQKNYDSKQVNDVSSGNLPVFTIDHEEEIYESNVEVLSVRSGEDLRNLKRNDVVRLNDFKDHLGGTVFCCHKKKSNNDRSVMVPRIILIAHGQLVVLYTDKNGEFARIKSVRPLSDLSRMTCFKKNTMLLTLYMKSRSPHGNEETKATTYQLQDRDRLISSIRKAMH